ncbi:carboxypeptidase-like regulatory domain-containing protein [Halosquirtibacter xylanolyticus]|uniref:hypothetical protein n=1 Tax=Halosquirtibacter xylanolyticus TaxID=3374599 RepID=UPI00374A856F|nr:carboxypeptidase-like regulatory domain-containing protein [Prolixibacteraceae bacterium]
MIYKLKFLSIVCLIQWFLFCPVQAQVHVNGRIIDENGKQLPSVQVSGYGKDSTWLAAVVTDTTGCFSLDSKALSYLQFAFMGYEKRIISIKKGANIGDIILRKQDIEIDAVTISATKNKVEGNKQTILFSKQEKIDYPSAKSLIGSNVLFQEQRLSRGIKAVDGRNVIFLQNGIEVSSEQLQSISSTNIRKIVYYDQPPARYANKKECVVVDIIMARPNKKKVTLFGDFFDDYKTTYGKNSVGVQYEDSIYTFNIRYHKDYQDFEDIENNERYELNNSIYDYSSAWGLYNSKDENLSADIQRDGAKSKLQWNISLKKSEEKEHKFEEGDETLNPNIMYRSYRLNSESKGAATRLYYSYDISSQTKVGANLQYSYTEDSYTSFNQNPMFYDVVIGPTTTEGNNHLHRYQGELFFNTKLGSISWHSGVKLDHKLLEEGRDKVQQLNYDNTYLYTSLSGKAGSKLSYYWSGGMEYISSQWSDKRVEDKRSTLYNTDLVLTLPLNSKNTLRGYTGIVNNAPSVSNMTNNPVEIVSDYRSVGNPDMEAYYIGVMSLKHIYALKRFYVSTKVQYQYFDKPFRTSYYKEGGTVFKSPLQQTYIKDLSLSCAFQLELSPLFTFGGYISWVDNQLKMRNGRTKSLQGSFTRLYIKGKYHRWFWFVEDREPYKNLKGENLENYGRNFFAEAGYRLKGIKLSLWVFHQPENRNIEVDSPVIKIKENNYCNDAKCILGANLSYRISFGEDSYRRKKRTSIQFKNNSSTLSEDSNAKRP